MGEVDVLNTSTVPDGLKSAFSLDLSQQMSFPTDLLAVSDMAMDKAILELLNGEDEVAPTNFAGSAGQQFSPADCNTAFASSRKLHSNAAMRSITSGIAPVPNTYQAGCGLGEPEGRTITTTHVVKGVKVQPCTEGSMDSETANNVLGSTSMVDHISDDSTATSDEGSDADDAPFKPRATRQKGREARQKLRALISEETKSVKREREGSSDSSGPSRSGQQPKTGEKKKVGRPITYKGDPNSAHLTEGERKRIKRRIANRESARRVRQKRLELLDELQLKIQELQVQQQQLVNHVNGVENAKAVLASQLNVVREKWAQTTNENMKLRSEMNQLRSAFESAGGMGSAGSLTDASLASVLMAGSNALAAASCGIQTSEYCGIGASYGAGLCGGLPTGVNASAGQVPAAPLDPFGDGFDLGSSGLDCWA
jgi:hypothetical protein